MSRDADFNLFQIHCKTPISLHNLFSSDAAHIIWIVHVHLLLVWYHIGYVLKFLSQRGAFSIAKSSVWDTSWRFSKNSRIPRTKMAVSVWYSTVVGIPHNTFGYAKCNTVDISVHKTVFCVQKCPPCCGGQKCPACCGVLLFWGLDKFQNRWVLAVGACMYTLTMYWIILWIYISYMNIYMYVYMYIYIQIYIHIYIYTSFSLSLLPHSKYYSSPCWFCGLSWRETEVERAKLGRVVAPLERNVHV